MDLKIPSFLSELAQSHVEVADWLGKLPHYVAELKQEWELELGEAFSTDASCSFVAPAKRKDGSSAIFKLGFPHLEALHEIDGLSFLQENVSVKLYDFDKEYNALLLEKCEPGMHLRNEPEEKQDEILAEIFPRLWNTDFSAAIFRPLKEMVDQWNQETKEALATFPDKELALKGCRLKDELIESTKRHQLLATDLHAGNVLSAQRKPWLVIDVKPYVGDPHYDLTQHLLNCMDRVELKGKEVIQKLAKACKLEEIRLQKWFYARLISEQEGVHQKLAQELFPEFQ
ncbi:MAG: aminoglycoside phosphotransferase family protein [Bacteroidia bacterium]|nr:aminoglycoside phosphotransferase family protein [Bacteroidia bacterium]